MQLKKPFFLYVSVCLFLACVLSATNAWSQQQAGNPTPSALPGILRVASATPARAGSLAFATGMQYGWDPNAIVEGDSRSLAGYRLALGYSPWSFLTLAVSADGILDSYQPTDSNDDDSFIVGAFGDYRIGLRTGWLLGSGFSLGGSIGLWIPSGRGVLETQSKALSPSANLVVSFSPATVPLQLHLDVGYVHDRSSHVLGDASQLAPEQLLLSGASSSEHHLSAGLGVEYRFGPVAPFVEAEVEVPFGDRTTQHAAALVGFGARLWLGPDDIFQLHLGMSFRVTDRGPTPEPLSGLFLHVPPRLNVHLGFSVRIPVHGESTALIHASSQETDESRAPELSGSTVETSDASFSEARGGRIVGVVQCGDGSCDSSARVRVIDTDSSAIAPDEETGRFASMTLFAGDYQVEARALGYTPISERVAVTAGEATEVSFSLQRATSARSRIEGRVTNFRGEALQATIIIPALDV
jgi:hypothetical protein